MARFASTEGLESVQVYPLPTFCLAVAFGIAIAHPAASAGMSEPGPRPRQAVIISFDGAHDVRLWQRSRVLAATTGARFTYFLSCVYLLSPENRSLYIAPGQKPGRSMVGFATSADDVTARLSQIWQARSEGHEIASHGCGHFDGGKWGVADWTRELASFTTILRDAWRMNGTVGEPGGWKDFVATDIRGFRAPYLSAGDGLRSALAEAGFRYDASSVSRGPKVPGADGGLATFALPMIPEGPAGRNIIAMDYNLFVRHSGGFERPEAAAQFEERTFDAFRTAFDKAYRGDRVPLQLGFHFTLMNGGAYWRALERFAREVCTMPDVACMSYADYLDRGPGMAPTPGVVGG